VRDRHRDRRGRGLRGSLAPPGSPLWVTPAERFDQLVLDAVEALEDRWAESLSSVEFAVEEVPPEPVDGAGQPPVDGVAAEPVPLGRTFPAGDGRPARVVVYRRPVEGRTPSSRVRDAFVHDLVVELVAELLGLEPDTVDPDYPEEDGWS
jgi:predicted Zn-dependent protease with MMP-like domain